jgi:predicted transcriptional regulator
MLGSLPRWKDVETVTEIRIPDSLARRLDAFASAAGVAPDRVAKEAIERQLDLESWWKREVAKGIVQADAGKLVPSEQVMRRARRLLARHAAKKTAR